MTTATTLLEQVAERGRRPILVAVGAGDLAVEQARTVLATLRSRADPCRARPRSRSTWPPRRPAPAPSRPSPRPVRTAASSSSPSGPTRS